MPSSSALPFHFGRNESEMTAGEYASTTERIHGLLRLEGECLVLQWRAARDTQRYGEGFRTDREVDPVREVVVPLTALAGAAVRVRRWPWPRTEFVLTASDLRAFEAVAGAAGLRLDHPATLVLPIGRDERLVAREFAADLNLALAERALQRAEMPRALPPDRA